MQYNEYNSNLNNQENDPNALSGKKALKGYLIILIVVVAFLSVYFLSDSKSGKKEDVKESNSNSVSETLNDNKTSNTLSNQNVETTSNSQISNKPNQMVSNKTTNKSVPVKSISISGAKTVVVGSKITLKATISPNNASNKKITWKSSDKKVATVSSSGVVTGVSKGTTTISASTVDGNKKATYKITVTAKQVQISKISINSLYQNIEIPVGSDFNMKDILDISPNKASYNGLKYSSSNPKVATVASDGTVKPIAIGNATITVVAPNGAKASLKFSVVNKPPTTFYIYGDEQEITLDDLIIQVTSVSDSDCSISQTCKGTITLVVNMGKSGNLKKYTLETNGSKVSIAGTNYQASAKIEDGRLTLNIFG